MTRTHNIDTHHIDAALRTLDVADPDVDAASPRARTDLERILATPRSPAPARRHLSARRLTMVGGAVATVAAGVVALPALTGGDQAFASWTAVPQGMTAAERADAADSCRESQEDGDDGGYAEALSGAEPVIAERRGAWTTVVLAGRDGFSAMCISDDTAHLFAKDVTGSIGTPTGYAAPRPREVTATDLGSGTMKAGDFSLAAGVAGPDVVGVSYRSPTHGDVVATVSDGRFALWLPGDELKEASADDPVEVEVTFSDGDTGTRRLAL